VRPDHSTDCGCDFGIARHEGFFESRARGHQGEMIRIFFLEMGNKNPRISKSATGQPAVESPKRVPDRQTGQPSFVLGGQYPRTIYYVNPWSVFRQS
jgi:hypothetical protein